MLNLVSDDLALTGLVEVTGTVNTAAVGEYTLAYNVTDASGNPAPAVTRIVNVVDTTGPVLVGEAQVTLSPAENAEDILVTVQTDEENVTFEVAGEDAAAFVVSENGELSFVEAPDFETPADANTDGVYVVDVQVVDVNGAVSTQTFTVTVANVVDANDADADGDGIVDIMDADHPTNAGAPDVDNDGIIDAFDDDNRSDVTGGGGSAGLFIIALLTIIGLRRRAI